MHAGYINSPEAFQIAEFLDWGTCVAVTDETVRVARKFLNDELVKYKTWKEFRVDENIHPISKIINTEPQFRTAKGQGTCKV